jgi:hypothetical protein
MTALKWNSVIVSGAIVFGNTGNSVRAETGSILGVQSAPVNECNGDVSTIITPDSNPILAE